MPSVITDYTSLKTQIKALLRRGDMDTLFPLFISMAEQRINRDIDTNTTETRISGAMVHPLAVPDDLNGVRSLSIGSGDKRAKYLEYITPQLLESYAPQTGMPEKYTIEGGNFYFFPQPDSSGYTYTLVYDAQVAPLTDAAPTNVLLTKAPDLYLYCALCESVSATKDTTSLQIWEEKYRNALEAIKSQNLGERYGGSPLHIEVI